jgi:hypothetical protein
MDGYPTTEGEKATFPNPIEYAWSMHRDPTYITAGSFSNRMTFYARYFTVK